MPGSVSIRLKRIWTEILTFSQYSGAAAYQTDSHHCKQSKHDESARALAGGDSKALPDGDSDDGRDGSDDGRDQDNSARIEPEQPRHTSADPVESQEYERDDADEQSV